MVNVVTRSYVHGHRRIDELARPKPLPPGYVEDRRSVYWIDYAPPTPGPDGVTIITASKRIQELAEPTPINPYWVPPRNKMPGVKPPKCTCRKPRLRPPTKSQIDLLSKPKVTPFPKVRMDFDRFSLKMPIKMPSETDQKTAKRSFIKKSVKPKESPKQKDASKIKEPMSQKITAQPEEPKVPKSQKIPPESGSHIEQLAKPKPKPDPTRFIKEENEFGFQPVSAGAKSAKPTQRIEKLSTPTDFAEGYEERRFHHWKVARTALQAIASLRLQQIARPRQRTMVKDDYDPYKIPQHVKKATCTPRLEELSEPVPRKVREKTISGALK